MEKRFHSQQAINQPVEPVTKPTMLHISNKDHRKGKPAIIRNTTQPIPIPYHHPASPASQQNQRMRHRSSLSTNQYDMRKT